MEPSRRACGVLRHGLVGDASDHGRIGAVAADVVLQAEPGRRHFRHRCQADRGQIGGAEVGARCAADDEERVARHHVAEADYVRRRVGIMLQQHAQRAAPHHVDIARLQGCRGSFRAGGFTQADVHALGVVCADRVGGVERGIEYGTEIL